MKRLTYGLLLVVALATPLTDANGRIATKSRMIEGGDYGVSAAKSTMSMEHTLFNRERILWMDKDEPVTKKDQDVEKSLLDAIGKSF